MFKFLIFVALVATAFAGNDDVTAEVKSDVRADGFDYALDTSNSIHQVASGDEHGNIKGSYEYVTPEGQHVHVDYVADEYGYQPTGDVLPTSPPIPEAIIKSINYIKGHTEHHTAQHG